MALITCPECGREISDKAAACPHCGCPSSEFKTERKDPYETTDMEDSAPKQTDDFKCVCCGKPMSTKVDKCPNCGYRYGQSEIEEIQKYTAKSGKNLNEIKPVTHETGFSEKKSERESEAKQESSSLRAEIAKDLNLPKAVLNTVRWGAAAFVFLITVALMPGYGSAGTLTFVCFILCGLFVSPLSDKIPFHIPKSIKIIIPIVLFIMGALVAPTEQNPPQDKETVADFSEASEESVIETSPEIETDVPETAVETATQIQTDGITPESLSPEIQEDESETISQTYIDVFDLDLKENWSNYVGTYIQTTFEVGSCKEDYIESAYEDGYFRIYPDNYRDFEYGDYITVTGKLTGETASYIEIEDAHILKSGSEAHSIYKTGLSAYNERKAIEAAEYEAAFKEEAEIVSYEDLNCYPDTYENKRIKITVKITDVEPDGIIFSGHYEAVMGSSNNKIALYDEREVKEPKLLEGDSAIIYGFGDGLTTIKVKDTSGIIPKTVDKYTIPGVNIKYVEIN